MLLTTFSWTKVVCYDLDVVELDAGDLSAVLREVERAVGHLSADNSAAVHLDVVERAAGDFRADEPCCMPPGGRTMNAMRES